MYNTWGGRWVGKVGPELELLTQIQDGRGSPSSRLFIKNQLYMWHSIESSFGHLLYRQHSRPVCVGQRNKDNLQKQNDSLGTWIKSHLAFSYCFTQQFLNDRGHRFWKENKRIRSWLQSPLQIYLPMLHVAQYRSGRRMRESHYSFPSVPLSPRLRCWSRRERFEVESILKL